MIVYTLEQSWEILRQIVLQKMPMLAKKIIFSDEAHFDLGGYVNKQNCRLWHTENPPRIHWKADATKTSHCLVRILLQMHNRAIFLRKWVRRGCYSQWWSLSGHVERSFVHKNLVKKKKKRKSNRHNCINPVVFNMFMIFF